LPAAGQVAASAPHAPTSAVGADADAATAHPALWPQAHWPWRRDTAMEARIAALIKRMTLEEKVGQILQADLSAVTPEDVHRYHLGSVLNGGNAGPGGNDYAPAPEWLKLADAFYDASVDKRDGGVAIPVMWGTDAVHGHSNIVGATLFPHNSGLGATHDPALLQKIAAVTATEVRVTGIDWTFAPTITVPQDTRWGRAFEGYSEDPALVASYARPFIEGLQGKPNAGPLLAGPHVIATAKHFLADGGTFEGRDQGDAVVDEATLIKVHALPYVSAIDAGVLSVMASFSSWHGVKMTGNKSLLTDVLKKRMGFAGLVVSDWNAHGQVAGCSNASCPQAVNAGIDLLMAPDSWKPLYHSLIAQVRDGTVPMARLDEAVGAVLRVKMRAGLFEAGRPPPAPMPASSICSAARSIAPWRARPCRNRSCCSRTTRACCRFRPRREFWSQVTARTTLPGNRAAGRCRGRAPGSIPSCSRARPPCGRELRQRPRRRADRPRSPDGSFSGAKPDAAIVVFGETPYAEFQGDLRSLQLKPDLRAPLETMRRLKAQGVPVVAVMLTGRPLYTNPFLNLADAFVVAWLPGSEGEGVADVLLRQADGTMAHDFTGRLPFRWPNSAVPGGATLYPLGYGLSAKTAAAPWQPLPEQSGVDDSAGSTTEYFQKGVPTPGWSLEIQNAGTGGITRITSVPASVADSGVTISATDYQVQEGARTFAFSGTKGEAALALTTHAPADLSRETNGEMMLVATVRVDSAPTAPVSLGLRSAGKTARLPLGKLDMLPRGAWTTLGVPLQCLRQAGAKMDAVEAPLILSTPGAMTVSLARVKLGMDAQVRLACATH
jgi:beta-glucosidase